MLIRSSFYCALFMLTTGLAEPSIFGEESSEPPEMATDRPDQTETSNTVPPGYVQLEVGFTHAQNRQREDSESDSALESLMRIGLMKDLELRLGHSGYTWQQEEDELGETVRSSGAGDSEIGFKYRLWEETGARPEAAFIAMLGLPTGERGFSSERLDPSYRFSFAHTLTERLSLGYNLGMVWASEPDGLGDVHTVSMFQYTATLGYDVTDRLGAFIEVFGDCPFNTGRPAHLIDGGLTYGLRENLQLDCATGFGLTDAADDWFISVGISYRFPR